MPIIGLEQYGRELSLEGTLAHRLRVSVLVSDKANGGAQRSGARGIYIKRLQHNTDAEGDA